MIFFDDNVKPYSLSASSGPVLQSNEVCMLRVDIGMT